MHWSTLLFLGAIWLRSNLGDITCIKMCQKGKPNFWHTFNIADPGSMCHMNLVNGPAHKVSPSSMVSAPNWNLEKPWVWNSVPVGDSDFSVPCSRQMVISSLIYHFDLVTVSSTLMFMLLNITQTRPVTDGQLPTNTSAVLSKRKLHL